jgi:hypothetical protein
VISEKGAGAATPVTVVPTAEPKKGAERG